ncbi:MAG: B12-binding domain-containing radical SAM protein [Nitrospirae bacterium]|nr:B12-binding domain-containing radical SAM protein [Nitrospirota bacterium]
MARVFLIMPRLPQKMAAPYLGQQYVASSLLKDGHEVRCLDMAAVHFHGTNEDVVRSVGSWRPDMIGMTLFTWNALAGYRLADMLKGMARLMIAGGPHPTVCPDEPPGYGFDAVVKGEGERSVVEYARRLDGSSGKVSPSGPLIPPAPLDTLAFPVESLGCYDSDAYSPNGFMAHGGMITSRGCPGRCTFCATYVTGNKHRWRSASNVIEEMVLLREKFSVSHFSFWDDAFTAHRPRVYELCDAIDHSPGLKGVTWGCITPANTVKPDDLRRMKKSGCFAINFGIESGDTRILRSINKGQQPEQVKAAITAAKMEGMTTIVNFMSGFPNEGIDELERTLEFMTDVSGVTDIFNNGGVLVPYPGTEVYNQYHEQYRFTRWWLNENCLREEHGLFNMDADSAQKYLEHDHVLDLDFFRYSDEVREKIAECVRFKAQHNQRYVERWKSVITAGNETGQIYRGVSL